jgi:hypothetical protein
MKIFQLIIIAFSFSALFLQCGKKSSGNNDPDPAPVNFTASSISVDGKSGSAYNGVSGMAVVKLGFPLALNKNTVASGVSLKSASGTVVAYTASYEKGDSVLVVQPSQPLAGLSKYLLTISSSLKSSAGGSFTGSKEISFSTAIDSTDKFPRISNEDLLTLVQRQTFKYFWDFAHPVSGLARERNTSAHVVTSGGSGFGVMAIITAVHRQFISRAEGLERLQKIVDFLKTKADRFHGAFPHWLNGTTGKTVPFSAKDDGADLVETSFSCKACLLQDNISTRQMAMKPLCEKTSTNCGMPLNGIGFVRVVKMFYTGTGARTTAGI